ncbi:uncharacterized protein SCHCODRAFT_01151409 [Schizophyllum commune H4-8]|nr:uncharacterized protein SCHCODRAFT_01151409 [Schizophyllum commune H4-8]KAI5896969.1 hypothetical protein SCHCODRAFT_01151409 [Schizophyllum commune H4-8]
MNAATQNAHYSYRHFPKQIHKAFAQQEVAKPPPGRNVAFREPIADPTHLYTPLATDSQSGTPIGTPATTPFTPAIGGMLPLPAVTPMVGYAPTLAPPTPYPSTIPLSAQVAAPATSNMAPAPAPDISAPLHPPRAPSPRPVAPAAPPTNAREAVTGGKPPAANAEGQSKAAFNIYTLDMLPCLPARGIARDPKWKGASAEKINVLMPVDLLSCWLILYNAQRLKEVHFWHVRGNDSGRKFPKLEVRFLESFHVHNNEAWLANLLDSLRTANLKHLEVYYAIGCGPRFMHDRGAYIRLFVNAIRIIHSGIVCISPNHPVYALRSSRLEGHLGTRVGALLRNAAWTFQVRDTRLHRS